MDLHSQRHFGVFNHPILVSNKWLALKFSREYINHMWKKSIISILLTCFSSIAVAQGQYIAIDGQITKVGNTSGNGASFFIVVQGGTGPCVTTNVQTNIYFPASVAGTEKVFDRAYSTALAALASGKKVSIYNYIDGGCNSAAAIEINSN